VGVLIGTVKKKSNITCPLPMLAKKLLCLIDRKLEDEGMSPTRKGDVSVCTPPYMVGHPGRAENLYDHHKVGGSCNTEKIYASK
jgi:hypothetical protein